MLRPAGPSEPQQGHTRLGAGHGSIPRHLLSERMRGINHGIGIGRPQVTSQTGCSAEATNQRVSRATRLLRASRQRLNNLVTGSQQHFGQLAAIGCATQEQNSHPATLDEQCLAQQPLEEQR